MKKVQKTGWFKWRTICFPFSQ